MLAPVQVVKLAAAVVDGNSDLWASIYVVREQRYRSTQLAISYCSWKTWRNVHRESASHGEGSCHVDPRIKMRRSSDSTPSKSVHAVAPTFT